ncbi:MAG: hypothetical protein CL844_03775 [Crocinitomicaceae bacterium]|nr:hypothetical protein [Crocinitomicaceae bacterium]
MRLLRRGRQERRRQGVAGAHQQLPQGEGARPNGRGADRLGGAGGVRRVARRAGAARRSRQPHPRLAGRHAAVAEAGKEDGRAEGAQRSQPRGVQGGARADRGGGDRRASQAQDDRDPGGALQADPRPRAQPHGEAHPHAHHLPLHVLDGARAGVRAEGVHVCALAALEHGRRLRGDRARARVAVQEPGRPCGAHGRHRAATADPRAALQGEGPAAAALGPLAAPAGHERHRHHLQLGAQGRVQAVPRGRAHAPAPAAAAVGRADAGAGRRQARHGRPDRRVGQAAPADPGDGAPELDARRGAQHGAQVPRGAADRRDAHELGARRVGRAADRVPHDLCRRVQAGEGGFDAAAPREPSRSGEHERAHLPRVGGLDRGPDAAVPAAADPERGTRFIRVRGRPKGRPRGRPKGRPRGPIQAARAVSARNFAIGRPYGCAGWGRGSNAANLQLVPIGRGSNFGSAR